MKRENRNLPLRSETVRVIVDLSGVAGGQLPPTSAKHCDPPPPPPPPAAGASR